MKRLTIVLVIFLAAAAARAQQQFPTLERGLHPEKLYHFAGIDNVNIFNGNLTINLPIGPSYPLDGGLNYQLTLSYNSNLWDYEQAGSIDGSSQINVAYLARRSNAGAGWIIGYGNFLPVSDANNNTFDDLYAAPDGGEARFDKWNSAEPLVKYTTDGSGLRLRTNSTTAPTAAWIYFPGGTVQRHQKNSSKHWDLREIVAPRGTARVTIDPLTSRPGQCVAGTNSWWRVFDGHRTHYICFKNRNIDYTDRPMIDSVVLEGPQNQASTYRFTYGEFDVALPRGESQVPYRPWSHHVTVLKSVILPDQSSYKFEHEPDRWTNTIYGGPDIQGIRLPTGGRIDYTYSGLYDVPPMGLCTMGYYNPDPKPHTFGIPPIVIFSRTLKSVPVLGGIPEINTWSYGWSLHGKQKDANCIGPSGGSIPVPDAIPDELTAIVIEPDGGRTEAHYSVWPGDMLDDSNRGFKGMYYGFPYGLFDAAQNRFLSTERFKCNGTSFQAQCTELRSTFVRHDIELRDRPTPSLPNVPNPIHRLASQKVFNLDDPANCAVSGSTNPCHSETTENRDWDGFAHYRETEVSYDFGGSSSGKRIAKADWNKPGGVQRVIGSGDPWTLDEYENRTVEDENGVTFREQACFAPVPGDATQRFLRGKRAVKGASPADVDIVASFTLNDEKNLEYEQFFGGDKTPVTGGAATETNLCTALDSLSNPAFEIKHTWQNGVMATSQYTGTTFLSLDLTVDRTGLVSDSRDAAGVVTKYFYDNYGRIKRIEPEGGASIGYDYPLAQFDSTGSLISPAMASETANSSSGAIERRYVFDSFGRVWREKAQMPEGKYRLRETLYDAFGRTRSTSEWTELPADADPLTYTPPYGTTYDDFDVFGRVGNVKSPDESRVYFTYTGDRVKTRTSYVATPLNASSPVTTTETYDGFGQLVKIVEPSGASSATNPAGRDGTTLYAYDPAGRLATVDMTDENNVTQHRAFAYDGRGFLMKETHRENGDTDYLYDARGNTWKKTNGGTTLEYEYDPASRLRNVLNGGTSIKELLYGPGNTGSGEQNKQKGKLVSAIRHNELLSTGKVDVTETFDYEKPGGMLSKKTTLVEKVTGGVRQPIQKFEYELSAYDDLLLPQTVRMPTCLLNGCSVTDGIGSLTYRRSAAYLTSIDNFGSFTYHPSGMVETVKHETPQEATDTYSARFDMARPSKITFQGCTNTRPYFLPGFVLAKVDPNACALKITWPAATLCGGVSNVKYKVLRNNVEIASCLTTTSYIDRTAAQGNTYTYSIVAEGPEVENGQGTCQHGQSITFSGKPFEFKSCDTNTLLTVDAVRASLGVPARFSASLSSANGPLQDEELIFSVLGKVIGTARTAANGVAVIDRLVDVDPKSYPNGVEVAYAGGLFPAKKAYADLDAVCDGPSYNVTPLSLNVLSGGGLFPIIVVTPRPCTWTPIPASGAFFTIAPASQQQGTGTFKINVPDSQGAPDRASHVKVVNKFVVVQQGSGCTFRFDPSIAYVPYKSSFSTQIQVSAPATCQWSVTSSEGWLHLERSSGTGNGYIEFRADQNNGKQRMATLSLNGGEATASVNQYAPPAVKCPVLSDDLTGPGSVRNGQFISLRAHVEGTYLEYEWWINGRPTGKCEDEQCESRNVAPGGDGYPSPGESATFQLVVSNSCDTVVTRTITVTNLGESCRVPIITDSLFRDFAPFDAGSPFPGFEVQLWVVGLNFPNQGDLSYQWYEGFADDRSQKVVDELGGKTDTIKVRPTRTAFYWVEVSNNCGSNVSRTGAVFMPDPPPRHRRRAVSKDFTGDGKADLPWHNTVTGQNEIQPMSGTAPSGAPPIVLPPSAAGLQLQSIGDIDDNERPDLIFRNPQSGSNEAWPMTYWQVSPVQPLETRPDGRWSIGGVADLDNDYNDDIIWHNNATGENEIWFQTGTDHAGTWKLPSNPSADWGLHGADDFNRDENPDLFFHNRVTGENAVWYMNDAERSFEIGTNSDGSSSSPATSRKLTATIQAIPSLEEPSWMPAMIADMNGDGYPDIVWRNTVDGHSKVWTMIGATKQESIDLPVRTDLNWQIGGGGSTNAGNPGGGTDPRTATSIDLVVAPAPLGTAAAVTATLHAGTNAVAQRPLAFLLNGTEAVRLATDAGGTATAAVSVAGLAAGTYPNAITVQFAGDTLYAGSSASATLVIEAAPAEVIWSNPAPIVYGTPLSAAQLNATATVPGTFVYSPPAGTILNAGYQTLTVAFTPSDTSIAPITKNAVLVVNPAPSSVSWTKPEAIAYGTPLSTIQLNATSVIPGSFEYDPEQGAVLPVGTAQTLHVTFTPDSPNFSASTATTTIDVTRGRQIVQWSDPAPIPAFTPLGPAQLNARVIPTGTAPAGALTYDPPAGAVLDVGVHELRVTVAETADYEGASASADLIVNPTAVSMDLHWTQPAPIMYGTPLSATQLNATANIPGTFTYTPPAGTILNGGPRQLYVLFTPTDNHYQPSSATVTIQIDRAPQAITWNNPAPIVYGTPLSIGQLNATVQVVGPALRGALLYSPLPNTILEAGPAQTLTVTAQETENYAAATATVTIDVLKATPVITWPQPAPIIYKTLLGGDQLNATADVAGTFQYTPPAGTLLEAGTHTLSTQFTPADTRNYNNATSATTLVVQRATPVITWAHPAGIVYGTPLSVSQLNATADVPGTFEYTPPAGTILDAGQGQTLAVHFRPADTRNYNDADATTTLDVARASQTVVWATPASIVYGTPLSAAQLNARADVVGPSPAGALTYTPPARTVLDVGTHTLAVAAAETPNYEPASSSVTIDVTRAPLSLVIDSKMKPYGAPLPALTGMLTGVQNHDPITPSYATTATQQSPTGTYPITATLLDPNGRLFNYDVTIRPSTMTVTPVPLQIAANAAAKQYSDPLPELTATFTGFVLGETPGVLSGILTIQTTAAPLSAPGAYPITIGGLSSSNYVITYVNSTFTVLPEDARVLITSPLLVSAAKSGPATVTLSATVRDISATDDAAGDTNSGDIRLATLTFVDRATNQVLCNATIGLLVPSDLRSGVATCSFTRDFGGGLPALLVVGARAGGYYTRDAAADDVTMIASAPTEDSITAGGSINVTTSAGSRAPETGKTAGFNFNLKYDKNGIVDGKLTFTFTRLEGGTRHQYELSGAVTSLSISRTPDGGTSAIVGTATLRDLTVPSAPVVVVEGAPMIVTATDVGEPSTNDALSVTLFNKSGGLWLAAGWDGLRAVEQPVAQGNIAVHYKK